MLKRGRVLEDLRGVRVMVEGFRRVAEDAGFELQTFQRDVELKLRTAGIRVFANEDREADRLPLLYLNVTTLSREKGQLHAYTARLELIEAGVLRRHLGQESGKVKSDTELEALGTLVTTWTKGMVGYGDVSHARGIVKDLADEFANDYLAANPLTGNRLPASNPP